MQFGFEFGGVSLGSEKFLLRCLEMRVQRLDLILHLALSLQVGAFFFFQFKLHLFEKKSQKPMSSEGIVREGITVKGERDAHTR